MNIISKVDIGFQQWLYIQNWITAKGRLTIGKGTLPLPPWTVFSEFTLSTCLSPPPRIPHTCRDEKKLKTKDHFLKGQFKNEKFVVLLTRIKPLWKIILTTYHIVHNQGLCIYEPNFRIKMLRVNSHKIPLLIDLAPWTSIC